MGDGVFGLCGRVWILFQVSGKLLGVMLECALSVDRDLKTSSDALWRVRGGVRVEAGRPVSR